MAERGLILFAKLPRPGEVKTRLGRVIGMREAAGVYRELAIHAFDLAAEFQREGIDVYVFYAPGATEDEIAQWVHHRFVFHEQSGATLGDRMHHAFETVLGKAKHAVIIGTDVPDLDGATIAEAFRLLAQNDIVLGPATDGGYYLLGMNDTVKNVFDGIAWSTDRVLRETVGRVRSLGLACAMLPELSDIDTDQDYRAHRARRHP